LALGVALTAAPARAEEPAPTADTEETSANDAYPAEPALIARWVLTGVAAAGAVGGGVFGLAALSAKDRFDENPTEQSRDRGLSRAHAADAMFAIAGAAAIGALVLWVLEDPDEGEAQPSTDEEIAVDANGVTIRF